MANGSRHSLYVAEETVYGVTDDDPALELVRITGTTLGLSKDSLQSEEIRDDRQIADFRLGANQVGGDVNFELSYGTFDKLLVGAMVADTWSNVASTGAITLDQTATGVTRVAGSFVDDGFIVGQIVSLSGFSTGANGLMTITAVTALELTLTPFDGQTLSAETGAGDEEVTTVESIQCGTQRHSFSFVRNFADIDSGDFPYYVYRGVEINSFQLTISANSMITGTFSVIGQSQTTYEDLTVLGTPTFPAATTTSPLDSFTGSLEEGGVTISVVTEISMTLQNGIEPRFVVGDKNSILPSLSRSNLTGQVTAYFEDSTLVNKFINETEASLVFTLPDTAGNLYRFTIPRIKYTGGQPDVSGEGPITLTMPFQALRDPVTGSNMRVERIPA